MKLPKFITGLFMSDQSTSEVEVTEENTEGQEQQSDDSQQSPEPAVADNSSEQPSSVSDDEEPASDNSQIKVALETFGHDLSAVWGDIESVFVIVGGDFDDVAKKSLELIEHPAAKAYDAVKALLSHKQ